MEIKIGTRFSRYGDDLWEVVDFDCSDEYNNFYLCKKISGTIGKDYQVFTEHEITYEFKTEGKKKMSIQYNNSNTLNALEEGQAEGILMVLEFQFTFLPKNELKELFRQTLKQLNKDEYWVDWFFPEIKIKPGMRFRLDNEVWEVAAHVYDTNFYWTCVQIIDDSKTDNIMHFKEDEIVNYGNIISY